MKEKLIFGLLVILLVFSFIGCGDGSDDKDEKIYTVTIGTLTNGSIIANPTSGKEGTEISLTITPNNNYQLKTGTLKYGTTAINETTKKFNLPAADVTITAEFEAILIPAQLIVGIWYWDDSSPERWFKFNSDGTGEFNNNSSFDGSLTFNYTYNETTLTITNSSGPGAIPNGDYPCVIANDGLSFTITGGDQTQVYNKYTNWWTWVSTSAETGYASTSNISIIATRDDTGCDVNITGIPNASYLEATHFGYTYTATVGKIYRVSWKWVAIEKPFENVGLRYAQKTNYSLSNDEYMFGTKVNKLTIPTTEESKSYIFIMPDNCYMNFSFMVGLDIGLIKIRDFKIEEIVDDNNDDGNPILGETLTINEQVYYFNFEDNLLIVTYSEFDGDETITASYWDVENLEFVPIGGSASIANGQLNINIGTPSQMKDISLFFSEFYELSSWFTNINISSTEAKGVLLNIKPNNSDIYRIQRVGVFEIQNTLLSKKVEYIYVDRDVTISGNGIINQYLFSEDFSLNLKQGWNILCFSSVALEIVDNRIISSTMKVSLSNPSNLRWRLENN